MATSRMTQESGYPMERGMRGNLHVSCGVGEKPEIGSKVYLSLYHFVQVYWDRSQNKEMRFHYFLGFEEPCMLYEETETAGKTVYLNKKYESALLNTGMCVYFPLLSITTIPSEPQVINIELAPDSSRSILPAFKKSSFVLK